MGCVLPLEEIDMFDEEVIFHNAQVFYHDKTLAKLNVPDVDIYRTHYLFNCLNDGYRSDERVEQFEEIACYLHKYNIPLENKFMFEDESWFIKFPH